MQKGYATISGGRKGKTSKKKGREQRIAGVEEKELNEWVKKGGKEGKVAPIDAGCALFGQRIAALQQNRRLRTFSRVNWIELKEKAMFKKFE